MLKIDIKHELAPAERWHKMNFDDHFNVRLPKISKNDKLLTLGSCFAQHIIKGLQKAGVSVNEENDFVSYDDLITTTQAMLEHFKWCTSENSDAVPPIYFKGPTLAGDRNTRSRLPTDEEWEAAQKKSNDKNFLAKMHKTALSSLKNASCVILTFGLSELWYDEVSGNSVWKWPGEEASQSLKFKILTAEENSKNLHDLIALIRTQNKACSIVISLSPIPLRATFRSDNNIFVSNSASKSRLRAGIDQFFVENKDDNVYYWPTYEFLTHPPSSDNFWDQDERHVKFDVIYKIVDTFVTKVMK